MNSVLPRSTARSIALICAGSVLSSMWKRGQPGCRPKVSPSTSGPRLDPPMPKQHDVGEAALLHLLRKAAQPLDIGQFLLDDVQPAEPFVLVRPGPQRLVAGPKPPDAPVLAPDFHLRFEGGLHLRRSPARSPGGGDRPQAACGGGCAMAPSSLSNASANCCTPSVDQFLRDLLQRDAVLLQLGEHRAGARHVLLDGVGRCLAVVAERIHRRGRDGVDGVAADERLDIHRVLVGRILGAGGSPKQALRLRARCRQRLPARAGEQRLVAGIGELGVGDRHLAAQRDPPTGLSPSSSSRLSIGGVDAADEEAGDAADLGDVAACPRQILEPRDVGFGHLLVDLTENSKVMLMFSPRPISWRMAGMPAGVAGTFTIRLGRSTAAHSRSASAMVASVSLAR